MQVRTAKESDLDGLMKLYAYLHNTRYDSSLKISKVWQQIMADPNHQIVIALENEKIISSCVCLIVPNLTRDQRPYALIENVVTDPQWRKRGFATACLEFAISLAQKHHCYKVMLMTGAKDVATLQFYQKAGFNSQDKTAFIRWL